MPKSFPLQLLLLASGVALALPAHAIDDDRFTLRIGAMNADAQSTLRGRTDIGGDSIGFSEDFDFGGKETVPRLEGQFRFSERNRLLFNYFNYNKDRRLTLDDDLDYDGNVIPAGSFAKSEVDFEVASVVYDFAVTETETFSWGLQLGAEYAKLEAKVVAEAGEETYRERESSDGFAPVIGTRFTWAPADAWRVVAQGQYLNASWGSFGDYRGDLSRANALVEYRFTQNFGIHVGYDWFKLDVDKRGSDGVLGLEQEFKGPIAGITLAF